MFSVEYASSMGPAVMRMGEGGGGGGGGQQASSLVAKQDVEFPQVLASNYNCTNSIILCGLIVVNWTSCHSHQFWSFQSCLGFNSNAVMVQ